jgi:myo-inositol-1(or 4)-monophosphatase
MEERDLFGMLEVAKAAARKSGLMIKEAFEQKDSLKFSQKEDKTYVSEVDWNAEKIITSAIRASYSNTVINGEEFGVSGSLDSGREDSSGSNVVWHVDPLDGTSNFKNRITMCGVSIGIEVLKENGVGEFVIGVVYDVFLNKMYWAMKGHGAYCNGRRISVSDLGLDSGVVVLDGSFGRGRGAKKVEIVKELLDFGCGRIRVIGSNVLQFCYVASGSFVASLSDHVATYDFAAGVVIVREAGGIVSDENGSEVRSDSKVIVATNSSLVHEKLLAAVKGKYDGF